MRRFPVGIVNPFSLDHIRPSSLEVEHLADRGREDQQHVARHLIKDFFSVSRSRRTQLLEECLGLKLISSDQLTVLIEGMEDDEAREVGLYLGQVIRSTDFVIPFHRCWHAFTWAEKDAMIVRYTKEESDAVLLIAPFVVSNLFCFDQESGTYQKSATGMYGGWSAMSPKEFDSQKVRPRLLEIQFQNFEQAKRYVEVLLSFSENHPRPYVVYENIQRVIDYCTEVNPLFLFPYLPELVQRGHLTQPDANAFILNYAKAEYSPMPDLSFYQTSTEREEEERLLKKIRLANPSLSEDDVNIFRTTRPRHLVMECIRLRDVQHTRAAEHILSTFGEQTRGLSIEDQDTLLLKFLDRQIPIFVAHRSLGFSKDRLRGLLVRAEQQDMRAIQLESLDDLRVLIEAGLEPEVVRMLRRSFEQFGVDSTLNARFVLYIESTLSWFTASNQQKILRLLTKRDPAIWLHRLDYAIEHQLLTLKEITNLVETHAYIFFDNYGALKRHVRQSSQVQEQEGPKLSSEELRSLARSCCSHYPDQIENHPEIFLDVFTAQEREELIRQHLRTGQNVYLLQWILKKEQDPNLDVSLFLKEVPDILQQRPELFVELMNNHSEVFTRLHQIFPRRQLMDLIMSQLEQLNFATVNFDPNFFLFIAKQQSDLQRFMKLGLTVSRSSFVYDVVSHLQRMVLNARQVKTKEQKKVVGAQTSLAPANIATLEQMLKAMCSEAIHRAKTMPVTLLEHVDALRIPGISPEDIPQEVLEQYMHLHPGAAKALQHSIPMGRLERIFFSEARALAFVSGRSNEWIRATHLPKEFDIAVRRLNPFFDIDATEKLTQDYYLSLIDRVKSNPFFSLVADRLERIAKREIEKNGPQIEPKYVYVPDREFVQLITHISLLAASKSVVAQCEALQELPPEQAGRLRRMLEFISFHALDEGLSFDLRVESVETVAARLEARIVDYVLTVFGIDVEGFQGERVHTARIPTDVLPMLLEYQQSCIKSPEMDVALRHFVRTILTQEYLGWRSWGEGDSVTVPEQMKRFEDLQGERLLPQKLTFEDYQTWLVTECIDVQELLSMEAEDMQRGVRDIFRQALADGHIEPKELDIDPVVAHEQYQDLLAPMAEMNERLRSLPARTKGKREVQDQDQADELRVQLQAQLNEYRTKNQERIDDAKARLYLFRLNHIIPSLINHSTLLKYPLIPQ